MKKITAFAFCLTLAFFLAACGKAPRFFHGRRFPAAGFFRQRCILRRVIHSGRRFLRARVFQLVPSSESPSVDTSGLDAPLHIPACHASGRRRR